MSDAATRTDRPASAGPEETMSMLFANMVIQQTNLAMMLLGKVPHPETGKHVRELDSARMFIDQLEMLEVKTKGNLDKREDALLKQSLMALRMAFVEAVDAAPADLKAADKHPPTVAPAAPEASPSAAGTAPTATADEEESRKKFTKKY